MSHSRPLGVPPTPLDQSLAEDVAEAFSALASPSRLLILGHLQHGPANVGELGTAAGLSDSATSHQLRVLRHLGWVTRERRGRHIFYALHDPHVSDLLTQAMFHLDHVHAAGQARRTREAS